ncbi:MAG: DUF2752 domain-containing protein [Armatimonadota bacterium]
MGILPAQMKFRYLALATAVCTAAFLSLAGVLPAYHCPFATFLGFSCPMCGTTRAWEQLLHGDVVGAFSCNPLFMLWGGWCLVALADLVQKGFGAAHPTIGERCVLAVGRSKVLCAVQIVCFASMLVYVNAFGSPTPTRLCLKVLAAIHP